MIKIKVELGRYYNKEELDAAWAVARVAGAVARAAAWAVALVRQSDIIRELVGNPFRGTDTIAATGAGSESSVCGPQDHAQR